jgi:hypothetical protein
MPIHEKNLFPDGCLCGDEESVAFVELGKAKENLQR